MAKSVTAGKYDLVLDPTNLGLTIHESVGHPLELDRVLGYEANYAGTSFATLEMERQECQYGSKLVNIVADQAPANSLGAVGCDDEGVAGQGVESHQGWQAGGLPENPRPGPHRGPEALGWLLLRRQLELGAVPAHAQHQP